MAKPQEAASAAPGIGRALGMLALPAVMLTVVIVGYAASLGGTVDEAALRTALPYLIAGSHAVVFGVLLWVLRDEGRGLRAIGWRLDPGHSLAVEVVLGVALAVSLYLVKELAFDSIRLLLDGARPTFTSLFRFRWNPSEAPMLVVATTFIVVEESVYRGYALQPLVDRLGGAVGLAIMGLLFGLLHWGNGGLAIVFTGVIGVVLGGVFLWRRTLTAVVVAHALYNALVIVT